MIPEKGKLIKCIIIPLVVGGAAGLLTSGSMEVFEQVNKPAFAPPAGLFPVVWTILYLLMGISSYLVWISDAEKQQKADALFLYGIQLAVNFIWPFLFFNLEWYLFAFLWLILLWVLVFLMIKGFYAISKPAAYLNIPYLIWLTFAGVLNLAIWWLNR